MRIVNSALRLTARSKYNNSRSAENQFLTKDHLKTSNKQGIVD